DGTPYDPKEVDYLFGVDLRNNVGYLIRNNEQSEYWSKDLETARTKWTVLRLGEYTKEAIECGYSNVSRVQILLRNTHSLCRHVPTRSVVLRTICCPLT